MEASLYRASILRDGRPRGRPPQDEVRVRIRLKKSLGTEVSTSTERLGRMPVRGTAFVAPAARFIDGLPRPSRRLIGSTRRTRRIHGSLSGAFRVQLVLPPLRILEAAVHHENNRDP